MEPSDFGAENLYLIPLCDAPPRDFAVGQGVGYGRKAFVRMTPSQFAQLDQLWAKLPEDASPGGEHVPRFGLSGVRGGEEVWRASISFDGSSICTWTPKGQRSVGFDGRGEQGQKLRQLLHAIESDCPRGPAQAP